VRVTVGAAKGGVGKTTTAMMLGFVMAQRGRTLVVDVDQAQQSALTWRALAGTDGYDWPSAFDVVPWARSVDRVLDDYEHVVFDVGPRRADLFREAIHRALTPVVGCEHRRDQGPALATRPAPTNTLVLNQIVLL